MGRGSERRLVLPTSQPGILLGLAKCCLESGLAAWAGTLPLLWNLLSQSKAWSHVLEADCGLLLETQFAPWRLCVVLLHVCAWVSVCVRACGWFWPENGEDSQLL